MNQFFGRILLFAQQISLLTAKIFSRLVLWGGLSALVLAEHSIALGVSYVPIGLSGITIIVPAHQIDCLPSDDCVAWTSRPSTVNPSNFTDDPGFNYSDDTNQIHRIYALKYYSHTSKPLQLQCLLDAAGHWGAVASSSNDSATSAINQIDSNGAPLNINYGALQWPTYEHKWNGTLFTNTTNCYSFNNSLYAPTTDSYTYKHTQKVLQLRVINPDGNLAVVLPPSADVCRTNDGSANLWQKTVDCAGASRPTSFQIPVDEVISRISNYTTFGLILDWDQSWAFTGRDLWNCAYDISVDGIYKGKWGNVLGGPVTTPSFGNYHYGAHNISFSVIQCQAKSVCYRPDGTPTGFCTNTNTVIGKYNGPAQGLWWAPNPAFKGAQTFNFTLQQPTQ